MFKSRKEKPKAMVEANDEKEGSHMKDAVVFSTEVEAFTLHWIWKIC